MTMKPFEIQGTTLTIGGVDLQAGTTGVVIPGISQATTYKVDEVFELGRVPYQGRQAWQGGQVPEIIDFELYSRLAGLVNRGNDGYIPPRYVAILEDSLPERAPTIEEIEVDFEGVIPAGDAVTNTQTGGLFWAFPGESHDINNPGSFVASNWVREDGLFVKCEVGEVESIGGGGGASALEQLEDVDLSDPQNGQALVWDSEEEVWRNQTVTGTGNANTGNVQFDGNTLSVINENEFYTGFLNLQNNDNEVVLGSDTASTIRIGVYENGNFNDWTFDSNGELTFPDGTKQTTAYTGQAGGSSTVTRYVAVNSDGRSFGSTNGVTWAEFTTGIPGLGRVAVGPNTVVYSGDSVSNGNNDSLWYASAFNETPTEVTGYNNYSFTQVKYYTNISKFVAIGANGNQLPVLMYSTDGQSWTEVGIDPTWLATLNGGNGITEAIFEDMETNGTGFLLSTSNIELGLFYTTDITQQLGESNWISVSSSGSFGKIMYAASGEFTGWHIIEQDGADEWFYNSSFNPLNGSFSTFAIGDVGQAFKQSVGYEPETSEAVFGTYNGITTLMIASIHGQVLYWPAIPDGPFVSIPKPYTSIITGWSQQTNSSIDISGEDKRSPGEKIVVTDSSVSSYNGTFFVDGSNFVYTDSDMSIPFDTSGFEPFTGTATITWSHGQYIDALHYSNNVFYAGNDDEEMFTSTDGGATWTLTETFNGNLGEPEYMNDIDSYIGTVSINLGDITFDGTDIQGDGTNSLAGSINLVPNPTLRTTGQFVSIYPTNNFDYPHVHMTAGEGGELYLGDDYQYVKTANDGSMKIGANNNSQTKEWTFGTDGNLTLPEGGDIKDSNGTSVLGGGSNLEIVAGDGISVDTVDGVVTISASNNASPQYGYFTELVEPGSSNSVNGKAVVMDSDNNSYVSYTYYDNNIGNDVGGIAKFDSTGEKLWAVNIASPNSYARSPEVASLELVTIDGTTSLVALGHYYDNNTNKDVAFIYYVNPTDGSINTSLTNEELDAESGMTVKDGVAGYDGSNPYVVVVGETYQQIVTKTFTPLAGSTTDKLFVSWEDFAASGVNNGESVYYVEGSNTYGVTMNAIGVSATTAGSTDPAWAGISISVSVNEAGNYTISRVNGWGWLVNTWSNPVTLTVLGADLGGVTGVNDMTFDFSNAVFNNDSNNIQAAISNIQGTPVTGVYCPGWGGYDWSTQVGNALTLNYYLNNQAYIGRFGQSGSWTQNFGGGEYDRMNSVVVDGDLNTYAVGYAWNGSRGALVAKYDYEGTQQWAVYIDPSDSTGNQLMSVDLLSDGNLITVDERGTVTKLNNVNGDIIWQVKADNGPSWDGDFRGTATPDGDYIITNYEDDNYTQYVMRVSGSDGSSVWNKRITRTYGGDNGEINADDGVQYIDCNATNLTIAGRSYPPSGNDVGIVYSFPINGENTDGTYGQFVITSESMDWTTKSTTSIAASVSNTFVSVTLSEANPTSSSTLITASITTMGGEPVVEPTVIEWTSPNDNVWRIEEYNGGASVQYWGGDNYSAKWFDIANHTSGSSQFRGAIIQYHAFIQNRGTIVGTIHLASDYTQQQATHTEHLSGDSDLQYVTLWDCNNERGQLFFKMTNEQNWQAMIQWTSTVFYGQESND